MPFAAQCCCCWHDEWRHGQVEADKLRQVTREEAKTLKLNEDRKNKSRKRKICIYCQSRLKLEAKFKKLKDSHDEQNQIIEDPSQESENLLHPGLEFEEQVPAESCVPPVNDKVTQRPTLPLLPYKNLSERAKRESRAEVIDTLKQVALQMVHFEDEDMKELLQDMFQSKKWLSTFQFLPMQSDNQDPVLMAIVKEYQESLDSEKRAEIRKKSALQTKKIAIGTTKKNSRISLSGEQTPEEFDDRVAAAISLGRIAYGGDERRRLLSIVAMDYPYRFLQEVFGCSPNTITSARVHCVLFGRGGTPPSHLKFKRQCVSPSVLEELSEFFQRDNVARPSSCRSVVINKEETPVKYWKDSIKNLVNQYLMEFPDGIKRTYIYTHLPANFRCNTMLAGLCNLCDEYGHKNFEKMLAITNELEIASGQSLRAMKEKILKYQRYLKTNFAKQASRHSPCQELCMLFAFGECEQPL